MECFLQYLDDLDDLYGVLGLVWEKLRRTLLNLISCAMLLAVATGGFYLALLHPPVGLATSTVLFVTLLYRSVTVPSARWAVTA
jgi:uncharacterized membrane protein YGL010W